MATEVGHAYITLLPSMKGFSAATQAALSREQLGNVVGAEMGRGAPQAGAEAGGRFSRAFSSAASRASSFNAPNLYLAGFIRNLRTYGFAISGVTGLTVGFGLKTASSMEQAQVAFETMLGSASRAQSFLATLVKFAQRTPFDLPGVVSASQRLLAFGFTAKQVLPTLTAIGDASAGLGGGAGLLEQITTAIGQIQAKGRVQSDEILQLTEAGVPALRILANQFGTTTAKMQQFITDGVVPAKSAIPALLVGFENGTNGLAGQTARFGGLMQKQSTTLGGIFSNLKDTVSQGLAKAVQPLVPVLERVLPQAMAKLPGFFTGAATALSDFLSGLGLVADTTPDASSAFESLGRFVRTAFKDVKSTVGFIANHATAFKTFASAVLGAVVAVKGLSVVMAVLDAVMADNPVGIIVLAIGALAGAFIYAWKTSQTFRNVVIGVFQFIGKTAVALGKGLYDILTAPFKGVLKLVASMPTFVVGPLKGVAKSALNALDSVDRGLQATNTWLDALTKPRDVSITLHVTTPPARTILGKTTYPSGFIGPIPKGAQIGPIAPPAGTPGLATTTTAATSAAGAIKSAFGSVPTAISGATPKASKSAKEFADAILKPLQTLQQKAADLAKGITDAITGSTGLGSLTSRLDIMGNQTNQSLKGIIKGLVQQRAAVLAFRKELDTLGRRGLAGTDLNTLANLGLDQGGTLAQTLLGATGGQLRQISTLTAGITSGASLIGRERSQATFGAQIGAELVRTMHALEKKETTLDRKSIDSMEAAFKAAVKEVRPYVSLTEIDSRSGRRVLTSLSR